MWRVCVGSSGAKQRVELWHCSKEPVKPREVLPTAFEDEPEYPECDEPEYHDWDRTSGFADDGRLEPGGTGVGAELTVDFSVFNDPAMKRGMPLSVAFKGFGRIFSSSKGSAETFAMSTPVTRLNFFISHNWVTGRFEKYLALAYHFSFGPAALVALAGGVLFFPLILFEMLGDGYAQLVLEFLFLIAVLGWPQRGMAFLDKTCIHQVDRDLQRKGIESLSAYLNESEEMIILYTDAYLQRLWTVYELASMIILRPEARITVIPVALVAGLCKFLTAACPAAILWTILLRHLRLHRDVIGERMLRAGARTVATVATVTLPGIVWMRRWARERAALEHRVQAFRIRHAVCAVEEDRQTVYRNVSILMRASGLVPACADEATCLDAFEDLARSKLPTYLKASWGRFGIPWRFSFTVLPMALGLAMDAVTARLVAHDAKAHISVVIFLVTSACALGPLSFFFMSCLSAVALQLRGLAECAFVALLWLVVAGTASMVVLLYIGLCFVYWRWVEPSWILWANITASCLGLASTVALHWPARVQVR